MALHPGGGKQWGTGLAWRRDAFAVFHFVTLRNILTSFFNLGAPAVDACFGVLADLGVSAMAETPITAERQIRRLDEFTTSRQLIRIRAMLWREAGLGDSWWVPKGWHPDPAWVALMDLSRVDGIGRTTRKAIDRWLEANGM